MSEDLKRVLVIGSGGREHALCWKLAQSPKVSHVFVLPGNAGMQRENKVTIVSNIDEKNAVAIVEWCKQNSIYLVAVGPPEPLAEGISDELEKAEIKCFGPGKKGAKIEADKHWAKDFMHRHGIPTARYNAFKKPAAAKTYIQSATYDALVIKANGLTEDGKGVIVAENKEHACRAVDDFLGFKKLGSAGEIIVVEEKLIGEEVTIMAFVDSKTIRVMLPVEDYKRLLNNDRGPNTAGMGSYCPYPVKPNHLETVTREVLQRAFDGFRKDGISYKGVLYAGIMLTNSGPKALEFNCRFGDPEAQVLLPLLENDLFELLEATCNNNLESIELKFRTEVNSAGVVMVSKGYPETLTRGIVIPVLEDVASRPDHWLFYSGVARNENGELVTDGGRVLTNVVVQPTLATAVALATAACNEMKFDGSHHRTDVALRAWRAQFKYPRSSFN